ncbi:hypothetical protein TRIUR3_29451 [Triticum urartu]|uniref:Uncharacterized protein n=1 Tax=Triticum urartu TaxID=4572 RepID=M7ZJG6_TRIUA|nr:hypothetical protein TRIUR3_29451 [Triticum urartu]
MPPHLLPGSRAILPHTLPLTKGATTGVDCSTTYRPSPLPSTNIGPAPSTEPGVPHLPPPSSMRDGRHGTGPDEQEAVIHVVLTHHQLVKKVNCWRLGPTPKPGKCAAEEVQTWGAEQLEGKISDVDIQHIAKRVR